MQVFVDPGDFPSVFRRASVSGAASLQVLLRLGDIPSALLPFSKRALTFSVGLRARFPTAGLLTLGDTLISATMVLPGGDRKEFVWRGTRKMVGVENVLALQVRGLKLELDDGTGGDWRQRMCGEGDVRGTGF